MDAASGAAVFALNVSPGDHVLDLCAAPGIYIFLLDNLLILYQPFSRTMSFFLFCMHLCCVCDFFLVLVVGIHYILLQSQLIYVLTIPSWYTYLF